MVDTNKKPSDATQSREKGKSDQGKERKGDILPSQAEGEDEPIST